MSSEFRVYLYTYDKNDQDVVLPMYVDLNDPEVFEALALVDVRGEQLSGHTEGEVIRSCIGPLNEFDAKARVCQVGPGWVGRVMLSWSFRYRLRKQWIKSCAETFAKLRAQFPGEELGEFLLELEERP